MTIPTVPNPFFVGASLNLAADPLHFMQANKEQYGDLYHFRVSVFDLYVVANADLVRQVLVTDATYYRKTDRMKRGLGPFLGNGLFLSDGEFWRRQRKLASPAFHTGRIAAYADVMVAYAQEMIARWSDGETRDISLDMMDVTLRVVAKTLLDADLTADDSQQVGEAMEQAVHLSNEYVMALVNPPMWVPTARNNKIKRNVDALDEVVLGIIAQRREAKEDRGDLLSMLLLAQDDEGSGMTDQQVRDEAMTIFLAGHETTAIALTWALYLVAQHPEVEAALTAELDDTLGGRAPTYAALDQLPMTDMVLKEALRLYPPVWSTGRTPTRDVTVDGHVIKKGSVLLISPYVLHHDERYWEEPDTFNPWRFHSEEDTHRYAYLPFGAGPRVCIGNHFAMMEGRLILACIMQKYRLRLDTAPPIEPDPLLTLRPKGGMPMVLKAR